ncbi:hypothetical protein NP493_6g07016 [Ridgeia piscesae]|uniref:Reverse transcriptase domain-containing protein n=1 Tax=Ridgeia piscesae TaxID=27915 RepID=A0AAD9PG11_RIDPI|nr:hypothetical protein NP493_6g07016 [Ridgeia piscesae]
MQQQQVCGRGMGILGMWGSQPQRPGMMPQNPPASNPWGTAPGQQPATVPSLAGLGRGRGLFTPASGQPVRPPGAGNTAQPGITRPPPGFGLGKLGSGGTKDHLCSFKTKKENIKLNIIQCYAPTNDKDEETKEDFYNKLQTLCDKLKEKDMTILMGDLNAKIGSDNSGYEEVMGRQGLGKMNENGEMLADFCAFNNMIIGGSVFPHRRIHKATWVSPDHRTENQIDHICIGRKFRRSMQDVRVQRGADAASDHHLVLARMKMKLKKREVKRSTRTQYNVDFLKDRLTTETFRLTVRNKYEALQDLLDEGNMDIDTQWQQIKEMWTSTCSEVLGKKKYQQKDWISADTLNKVQVRKEKKGAINNSRTRAAKATAQEEYTEANRAVKNSVKTDKANFIEDLAKEAEDASAQGNMKQLYEITRKLAGKYKRTDRPIKDKNGNVLTSDEDQLKRWREHFEELLNRPPPQNSPDITPAEEVLQINCERPIPGKVLNRVILDRLKTGVDAKLRDHQAGFRKDQIATLRIIVEQSMEWDSSLYINFVDYEKAFDSLDRDTLWKLLQHYGIPNKLISLIRNSYEDMACGVIHAGQLTDSFMVKTGVRQGCLLSPFLFLLAIDWIMKKTTKYRRNGIQWTPWSQLEDLDFADDLALLSHSHQQMQEKTELLNTVSTQLGLNINRSKTRIMKANTKNNNPITMNGEPLEETDSFTYLGSTINKHGGTAEDVKARIQKARVAFIMLRKIWRAKQIKTNQTENIQFKCQGSFTLWIGDMAKYTEDTKKNTDLHQQMPA